MFGLIVAILLGVVVYLATASIIFALVAFVVGLLLVGGFGYYGRRGAPPV